MAKLSFLIPRNPNLEPVSARVFCPLDPDELFLDSMSIDTAVVRRTLVADENGMACHRFGDDLLLPFPFGGENQLTYADAVALCDQAEAIEVQS